MQILPALEYGRYYHIYNRGINRENIFVEERNYRYFLDLYTKYIYPVAETYAYCLMRNHFHLLVRIKTEKAQRRKVSETFQVSNPTQQFSNMFNAYAKAINKAYNRTGGLFQERFGRIPVTSDDYFVHLIRYIHFNPQKHGFVSDFREYPWSSYDALASIKPTKLDRDDVLAWFNGRDGFVKSHNEKVEEKKISKLIEDDDDY